MPLFPNQKINLELYASAHLSATLPKSSTRINLLQKRSQEFMNNQTLHNLLAFISHN